jgi:mannose-6-phosphate isomerase-like protein (cupin superfamily)
LDNGKKISIKIQRGVDGKLTSNSLEYATEVVFKDSDKDPIDMKPIDSQYNAPDGLKIWKLEMEREGVSFWRCIIPPKCTSLAREQSEFKGIWICRSGECKLWKKEQEQEYTIEVSPGEHFILTPETHAQLDNQSSENADFIIAMIPRSSRSDAWKRVKDYWQIVSRTHERYLYNEDKNGEPLYKKKNQNPFLGQSLYRLSL